MSNGCGCESGLFSHFKPPYAQLFDIPCRMHDDEYDAGGKRRDADRRLFVRMCKIALRQPRSPWYMIWLFGIAMLYYICVRTFGGFYFNKNKDNERV